MKDEMFIDEDKLTYDINVTADGEVVLDNIRYMTLSMESFCTPLSEKMYNICSNDLANIIKPLNNSIWCFTTRMGTVIYYTFQIYDNSVYEIEVIAIDGTLCPTIQSFNDTLCFELARHFSMMIDYETVDSNE